ncbi:hypothetical protein CWS02_11750 [Enterobacter sp. EA-1]|nr:hypothetical protein CWS02_11750 [Enterobacter sp. EA-1]
MNGVTDFIFRYVFQSLCRVFNIPRILLTKLITLVNKLFNTPNNSTTTTVLSFLNNTFTWH